MTPTALTGLNTRFGRLEFRPDQILTFSSPMIGFEKLRRYAVLPSLDCPPLIWLQSVEEGEIAFPVLDPALIFPDYKPDLPPMHSLLEADDPSQLKLLCVVCQEAGQMGLNLLAPIVVNALRQKAAQIVLQQAGLSTFRNLRT